MNLHTAYIPDGKGAFFDMDTGIGNPIRVDQDFLFTCTIVGDRRDATITASGPNAAFFSTGKAQKLMQEKKEIPVTVRGKDDGRIVRYHGVFFITEAKPLPGDEWAICLQSGNITKIK